MVQTLVKEGVFYYEYYTKTYPYTNSLVNYNLVNILKMFLINGSVNLRSLMNIRFPIRLSYKDLGLNLPYDNMNIHVSVAVELEILISLLGGKDEVVDAFEIARRNFNLVPDNSLRNPIYRNFITS